MKVIEQFLEHYSKERDFYSNAVDIAAGQCLQLLTQSGIKSIVTKRTKEPDRLRDKLERRAKDKKYTSIDDIYIDIKDLAGLRLALYFPKDREKIDSLIRESFDLLEKKSFPQSNEDRKQSHGWIFDGYHADHYIVQLKESYLGTDRNRYAKAKIEIQVASVLMHSWAEVEHDLYYKPQRKLSAEEYALLDQLNGLVLSGEIALDQLQHAIEKRASRAGQPFESHYELAAYLYSAIKLRDPSLTDWNISMDGVNVLFEFLQRLELNKVEDVDSFVETLDMADSSASVPKRMIRAILAKDGESLNTYFDSVRKVTGTNIPNVPPSSVIQAKNGGYKCWFGIDGKRYIFPTEECFRTWYPVDEEQPTIHPVSDLTMALIRIGGNVTYRPGVRLIKIASDPKIYAVSLHGRLRWIESDRVGKSIFGENWADLVDVVPDWHFVNYRIGPSISKTSDYDPVREREQGLFIDVDQIFPHIL